MEFLVVGGDRRSCLLTEEIRRRGFSVETLGIIPGDTALVRPEKADVVLLPYPFSQKEGIIRNQLGIELTLSSFLGRLKPGTVVFYHGRTECMDRDDLCWKLYDSDPLFHKENARISAEGALSALMLATEDSLYNMHCLVTGYGEFGQAITKQLVTFGGKVTVAARRQEALELARKDGARALLLFALEKELPDADVVLNTVPAPILGDRFLEKLPTHCLMMELASQPGGFDQQKARELHMPVISLPGIPGKYAPLAAAKALLKAVLNVMKELEQ